MAKHTFIWQGNDRQAQVVRGVMMADALTYASDSSAWSWWLRSRAAVARARHLFDWSVVIPQMQDLFAELSALRRQALGEAAAAGEAGAGAAVAATDAIVGSEPLMFRDARSVSPAASSRG